MIVSFPGELPGATVPPLLVTEPLSVPAPFRVPPATVTGPPRVRLAGTLTTPPFSVRELKFSVPAEGVTVPALVVATATELMPLPVVFCSVPPAPTLT